MSYSVTFRSKIIPRRRCGFWRARLRHGNELLGAPGGNRCWWYIPSWASSSQYFLQEVIFPALFITWLEMKPRWWTAADVHLYRDSYCNGIREMKSRFFDDFRVCRLLQTLPGTPCAHQCQQIHLQHKNKNYRIFDMFLMWFWDRFT